MRKAPPAMSAPLLYSPFQPFAPVFTSPPWTRTKYFLAHIHIAFFSFKLSIRSSLIDQHFFFGSFSEQNNVLRHSTPPLWLVSPEPRFTSFDNFFSPFIFIFVSPSPHISLYLSTVRGLRLGLHFQTRGS
jgi:hypothetical protein